MEASYHFLKTNIHTNISSDYIVATMKKQVTTAPTAEKTVILEGDGKRGAHSSLNTLWFNLILQIHVILFLKQKHNR